MHHEGRIQFRTSLNSSSVYDQMYHAYCRIFARCGLTYLPVEAESGPIGGDASHEFMVPANNGEDRIVHCEACGYAANLERADTGRRSPSIAVSAAATAVQKVATPHATSSDQVSRLLKCDPAHRTKTLIYKADEKPDAVLIASKPAKIRTLGS